MLMSFVHVPYAANTNEQDLHPKHAVNYQVCHNQHSKKIKDGCPELAFHFDETVYSKGFPGTGQETLGSNDYFS